MSREPSLLATTIKAAEQPAAAPAARSRREPTFRRRGQDGQKPPFAAGLLGDAGRSQLPNPRGQGQADTAGAACSRGAEPAFREIQFPGRSRGWRVAGTHDAYISWM